MTFMRMPSTSAGSAPQGQPPPAATGQSRLSGLARRAAALRQPAPVLARRGAALAPRGWALARRHWLLTMLLAAGLALRVMALAAYRPALIYIDSAKYLLGAYPGDDPPGYLLAIKPVLLVGNLDLLVAIQHLLGLAMAITLAALLVRRGAPRWLAALATAPVLLDGYQLQIEQTIMPDVMFEALLVAALAALLWHPRPRTWMVITCGLALGAAATARQVGEILLLPALLYLAITAGGWRRRLAHGAVLAAAFALPVLAASFQNYLSIHRFSLAPHSSGTIYGRMAEAADCATLRLPWYERQLCPNARQKLLGPDGLDHAQGSPIKNFQVPPGMHGAKLVTDFARRVLVQQPLNVASGIGEDAVKLFALRRVASPGDTPISRWQFQTAYPQYPPYVTLHNGEIVFGAYSTTGVEETLGTSGQFGGGGPVVVRPLAAFLRAYQLNGGYTPGPLFAAALLAGLLGSVAARRRRADDAERAAAYACLVFFTSGTVFLLVSDVFEFSWRYQLPALVTLPPAGVLAVTALLHRRRRRGGGSPPPAGQSVAAVPAQPARPEPGGSGVREPEPRDRTPAN
jgi:4-amino-4-deoxy-L-arabinose transferase-like glycosyltransferase